MSPICWARVDDRLIHGQVVVAWRRYLGFDTIYVVDDGVANDPYLREILCLAAAPDLAVEVYAVQEAVDALAEAGAGSILLLLKDPGTALRLVEVGIVLAQLNVGNLASGPGRRRVFGAVSLSADDDAALDALAERGVEVTFQATPEDACVPWSQVRGR